MEGVATKNPSIIQRGLKVHLKAYVVVLDHLINTAISTGEDQNKILTVRCMWMVAVRRVRRREVRVEIRCVYVVAVCQRRHVS